MNKEEHIKLHDETLQKCLALTNDMIEEGVKSMSWTLTNDFVVTFRDLKRKPRNTIPKNSGDKLERQ